MKLPTIDALITEWDEVHGRPIWGGIRIGPARCGIGRCMAMHAHAVTVKDAEDKYRRPGEPPQLRMVKWTLQRPCDGHWTGRYG